MNVRDSRRHGDIFPLPLQSLKQRVEEHGVQQSQRAYWIGQTLNKLVMHDFANSYSTKVLSSSLPLTATQCNAADRIALSLNLHGDCPDGLDVESGLQALKGSTSSYEGIPSNLAPYEPGKLKILEKGTCPKHIGQFLPAEAASLVKRYRSSIVRHPAPSLESFSPYWDPGLRYNRKMRLDFIVRLFRAGLMTLRPVANSFVGAFCVKKKDPNYIRMVIDCRGTNQLHQDPPVTRLASARCYSDLDLSRCGSQSTAWGREADVADCFYRFSLPELADFFAINDPLNLSQWQQLGIDVARVYDPRVEREIIPSADQPLYACFRVVPMGWTWALWLCNEAVLNIAKRFSPWNDGVLRERKPTPQLDEYRTVLGVYVDNITILGRDEQDVNDRCELLQQAFDHAGIPITWTQEAAVGCLESVGLILDLQQGFIMNKPSRVWKFYLASLALLRRKKLKGDILQIWTGHFTSLCSITPFGLAALEHTYRFISKAEHKRINVWSSVKKEIQVCASLAWLTWKSISAPFLDVVEVGDSSTSGYAMCACTPPLEDLRRAVRYQERWRFVPMPQSLKDEMQNGNIETFVQVLNELLGDQSNDSLNNSELSSVDCDKRSSFVPFGPSSKYAQSVFDSLQEGSYLATSAIRSQARSKGKQRVDIEIPSLVEPVPEFFATPSNFRLLWCRRWRHSQEHITLKEARVALSSLRRSSRVASAHGYRKLTISDNLPCVCSFSKGRSHNHKLNMICQEAAGIQFASGISWSLRHVETKRNVADDPSRAFEKKHRGVRQPFVGVSCETGSGLSREASAPSKPLKPHRQHLANVFPGTSGQFFLELFSGVGNLTKAVQQLGISCLEPIDYVHGSHCDLRRRSTQELVLSWIDRGFVAFCHLGTPCTIWSRARHNVVDSIATRIREETGIELALFSCEVIRHCIRNNAPYALENPRSSKLFQFEPLVQAVATGPFRFIQFDMCQYGEPYQKRTRIVTSVNWLRALERKCNHKSHEVRLKGKVKTLNKKGHPVYVNRTALAGAYPWSFAVRYAELIKRHLDAKWGTDETGLQWSAALRRVASFSTDKRKRDRVSARRAVPP